MENNTCTDTIVYPVPEYGPRSISKRLLKDVIQNKIFWLIIREKTILHKWRFPSIIYYKSIFLLSSGQNDLLD